MLRVRPSGTLIHNVTGRFDYRAFSLNIRSETEILGARIVAPSPPPPPPPDIEISVMPTVASTPTIERGYVLGDGEFTFTAPGVARYRCIADRRIEIAPMTGASHGDIAGLLIATALPALLWWRGEIVLHASAYIAPGSGRAIAIGGRSGMGKSTLLANAVAAGASVVADDSIRVVLSDPVTVSGLPGIVFSRAAIGSHDRIAAPVPPERQVDVARCAAFVVLDRSPGGSTSLRRLDGLEAVEALLASRHRPTIAELSGRASVFLPKLISLARRLPIYLHTQAEDAAPVDSLLLAARLVIT